MAKRAMVLSNRKVGGDVFVHYTAIATDKDYKTLEEGTQVKFDIVDGKKGLQAINVSLVQQ